MDLTTGQRTFCLNLSGLSIPDETTVTHVPFRDSSGNLIKCNYVRVSASKGGGSNPPNGVLVELSGVSHIGNAVLNELSGMQASSANINPSGVCGFGLLCSYLAVDSGEWHGSNGEVATAINLVIGGAPSVCDSYSITYGNLFQLNPLRLSQGYDKGV
jgi:hypothetical protein